MAAGGAQPLLKFSQGHHPSQKCRAQQRDHTARGSRDVLRFLVSVIPTVHRHKQRATDGPTQEDHQSEFEPIGTHRHSD